MAADFVLHQGAGDIAGQVFETIRDVGKSWLRRMHLSVGSVSACSGRSDPLGFRILIGIPENEVAA
jgi:hypothetical protein